MEGERYSYLNSTASPRSGYAQPNAGATDANHCTDFAEPFDVVCSLIFISCPPVRRRNLSRKIAGELNCECIDKYDEDDPPGVAQRD
jgi:hypothetical protein